MNLQYRAARFAMRVLQRLSPALAAFVAERLFFTPPRTGLAPAAREILRTGRPFRLSVEGARIGAWSWGRGPAVVLVHGWGGRGARLAATYVPPLVARGFSVIAFDAPGHGISDGRLSSMPQFARALQGVADVAGSVFAIVAHSMGGSATALAMSQRLRVERAVFLAPAADPAWFAAGFAKALAIAPSVMDAMRARSERRLGCRWTDLDVRQLVHSFDVPLLVIHDQDDPTVPWTDGAAIAKAWPHAELVTTNGLGHRDVVREPGVVARAVAFIGEGAPTSAAGNEGAWLERDLFRRDIRQHRVFQGA